MSPKLINTPFAQPTMFHVLTLLRTPSRSARLLTAVSRSLTIAVGRTPQRAGLVASIFFCGSSLAACKPAALSVEVNSRADVLFDANQYTALADLLREELPRRPNNAGLLWRLARALKKLADDAPKVSREALVREALGFAKRALEADAQCGPAHKWYAILLSESGSFGGTSEKIKNSFIVRCLESNQHGLAIHPRSQSFPRSPSLTSAAPCFLTIRRTAQVREHFELATRYSPSDATVRH
jgi:hypothetical protein